MNLIGVGVLDLDLDLDLRNANPSFLLRETLLFALWREKWRKPLTARGCHCSISPLLLLQLRICFLYGESISMRILSSHNSRFFHFTRY